VGALEASAIIVPIARYIVEPVYDRERALIRLPDLIFAYEIDHEFLTLDVYAGHYPRFRRVHTSKQKHNTIRPDLAFRRGERVAVKGIRNFFCCAESDWPMRRICLLLIVLAWRCIVATSTSAGNTSITSRGQASCVPEYGRFPNPFDWYPWGPRGPSRVPGNWIARFC